MSRTRFADIMRIDSPEIPLDEATLLISGAIQPGLQPSVWLSMLDAFAAGCPRPTPEAVAEHLFVTEHFVGNRSAYYDWRNSCLDRVIERRTGIPISLSVLMMEVSRRVGAPLVGVGMPAHFLVRLADDDTTFYDPFHGGVRLDRTGARALFEAVTNGQVPWDERYLDPTPNRDIVIRVLNNLKSVFAGRGDAVRHAMVMDLRAAVPELVEVEADEIATSSAVFN